MLHLFKRTPSFEASQPYLSTKMGVVASMPVRAPVVNKDESLWSVCGRVKAAQEVVDALLISGVLSSNFIH